MSNVESVGDHFLIGLKKNPVLEDGDKRLLSAIRPAGVILFKPNFRHDLPYEAWLENHRRLLVDIREAIGRERFLVAIDHEGGRVVRAPPPITRFAYAAHWRERAARIGHAMGRELVSLGVNLTFAPCLDIHSNPANPVIGPRAFGTTPEQVIDGALPLMLALHQEGLITCGKHFPGHGDTAQDSHDELPTLDLDLPELRARELVPFAAAIRAGVPMIMTAHILFPRIDAGRPATLSRRIISEVLRGELGFGGVVTTDDIGMRAVSARFDDSAAVECLASGSDMIMVCAHFTETGRAEGLARAVREAIRTKALPEAHIAASRARIQALLARAAMPEVRALSPEVFAEHARLAPLFAEETAAVAV